MGDNLFADKHKKVLDLMPCLLVHRAGGITHHRVYWKVFLAMNKNYQ